MYGFKGTECKIYGCESPVWPNKTLGFCGKHYRRYRTGRMAESGELLPLPAKTKTCESCGGVFTLNKMERNVRFCRGCRPAERRKVQQENNAGIYRRGKHKEHNAEMYLSMVLGKIIKSCELTSKHRPVLELRLSGKTYNEIAEIYGCTRQNVQSICSKHLSNPALNSDNRCK